MTTQSAAAWLRNDSAEASRWLRRSITIENSTRPITAIAVSTTGGGRGIGKETAIMLAKKGMNIVICSRTQKEIDAVVKEIKSMGNSQIVGRKCDVSKSYEVNYLVKVTLDKYGRIDVLINNAGITYVKKIS